MNNEKSFLERLNEYEKRFVCSSDEEYAAKMRLIEATDILFAGLGGEHTGTGFVRRLTGTHCLTPRMIDRFVIEWVNFKKVFLTKED